MDRVTIRCKAMGCISKGHNSYNTELHGMFVLYRGSTANATDNRGGLSQSFLTLEAYSSNL